MGPYRISLLFVERVLIFWSVFMNHILRELQLANDNSDYTTLTWALYCYVVLLWNLIQFWSYFTTYLADVVVRILTTVRIEYESPWISKCLERRCRYTIVAFLSRPFQIEEDKLHCFGMIQKCLGWCWNPSDLGNRQIRIVRERR